MGAYEVLPMMIGKNIALYSELELLEEAFKISIMHHITIYDSP